ncbi:hypothetical protein JKY79_02570 [Candidatus Babeliales bacterium]|nr:hypothetical protein [Candidatus Babeliales bacterium]
MNRQIILAFLLAVGSTAFATETELTTAESNRTKQQIVDSGNTVKTPKGFLHRYFIRKDKRMTCFNIALKGLAAYTLHQAIKFDKNYYNCSSKEKTEIFNNLVVKQFLTVISIYNLTDY